MSAGETQDADFPSGEAKSTADHRVHLKPHPRLFIILCVSFALWILALLVLYVTVIFPIRHAHDSSTAQPTAVAR
jgi:hypothetical protein